MNIQQRATYLPLVEAVDRYAEQNASLLASSEDISALKEIRVRLGRLDRQYARLLELNEILREGSVPKISYDGATATFQLQVGQHPAQPHRHAFRVPINSCDQHQTNHGWRLNSRIVLASDHGDAGIGPRQNRADLARRRHGLGQRHTGRAILV